MTFFACFIILLALIHVQWDIPLWQFWAWGLVVCVLLLLRVPEFGNSYSAIRALGLWILTLMACPPLSVFALRFGQALRRGEACPSARLGPVLAFGTGAVLVAVLAKAMAVGEVRPDLAVGVHFGLGALSVAAIAVGVFGKGIIRGGALGAGSVLFVFVILSGIWFPAYVKDRATAWAGEADAMLSRPHGENLLTRRAALTFLSSPKARRKEPHMILRFNTRGGTCWLSWSYDALDFRTDHAMVDSRVCPDAP